MTPDYYPPSLLPRSIFYARLARRAVLALLVLLFCLGIGMTGYHVFEHLGWVDSFANAAMILSGMGPLAELKTTGGKLFAGCYALFSGVAFLTTVGVLIAPMVHRIFHQAHLRAVAHAAKRAP